MRPVVLVESPYSGQGIEAIRYLACCLLDSFLRGEAPIASHAIGPLALPEREHVDHVGWPRDAFGKPKTGREIGKELHASLSVLHEVSPSGDTRPILCARYLDLGETSGMRWDAGEDESVERKLRGLARQIWESGEWPSQTRWERTNEGATR